MTETFFLEKHINIVKTVTLQSFLLIYTYLTNLTSPKLFYHVHNYIGVQMHLKGNQEHLI